MTKLLPGTQLPVFSLSHANLSSDNSDIVSGNFALDEIVRIQSTFLCCDFILALAQSQIICVGVHFCGVHSNRMHLFVLFL